jgi:hypothetical protein
MAMINENDSVFKKHENCQVEVKWIQQHGKPKMRLFCVEHQKWLHYLTDIEAAYLMDTMPYELQGN